jgi:hypothetical protein
MARSSLLAKITVSNDQVNNMAITGSCLCGGVNYSLNAPPLLLENCHCSMCRKVHGSAFTTFAKIMKADFVVTKGAELIDRYPSSQTVQRSFCRKCGAKFTFDWANSPEHLWLAVGTLDTELDMKPTFHIFVASKAPWFTITDDLPQFDGYPPDTNV